MSKKKKKERKKWSNNESPNIYIVGIVIHHNTQHKNTHFNTGLFG